MTKLKCTRYDSEKKLPIFGNKRLYFWGVWCVKTRNNTLPIFGNFGNNRLSYLGCLVRYAVANTPYHFSEITAYLIWGVWCFTTRNNTLPIFGDFGNKRLYYWGVWCVTLSLTHPTIFRIFRK